jgi:hypothetical protein
MKPLKPLIYLALVAILFTTGCPKKKEEIPKPLETAAPGTEVKADFNTPLGAAKTFFDSVLAEKYDISWKSLTKTSQDKFVTMVAEEEKMDPAAVRKLFDDNEAPIQMGFWKSFRASSKVTEYVPQAVYKVVSENGDQATVELTNKLVVLDSKVFKQGGHWRMGYVESFMAEESPKPQTP